MGFTICFTYPPASTLNIPFCAHTVLFSFQASVQFSWSGLQIQDRKIYWGSEIVLRSSWAKWLWRSHRASSGVFQGSGWVVTSRVDKPHKDNRYSPFLQLFPQEGKSECSGGMQLSPTPPSTIISKVREGDNFSLKSSFPLPQSTASENREGEGGFDTGNPNNN